MVFKFLQNRGQTVVADDDLTFLFVL